MRWRGKKPQESGLLSVSSVAVWFGHTLKERVSSGAFAEAGLTISLRVAGREYLRAEDGTAKRDLGTNVGIPAWGERRRRVAQLHERSPLAR